MPSKSKPRSRNVDAIDETIGLLVETGVIEFPGDTARVEIARNLALAVDAEPGNANLWRQYREAVECLNDDDRGSSHFTDLLGALGRLSPSMGDET